MTPDEAIVAEKLGRLGALMMARDPAVVDELWSERGFRLVGSEAGETASTRAELAALMKVLFALPNRLSWAWRTREATRRGDILWATLDGDVVLTGADTVHRKPYRLVCIFERLNGRWEWRLYSGSEPAAAPPD